MIAYVKFVCDAAVQLAAMYGLGKYFGEPETIALKVAALTAAVTYCLACANYKQISYLARAGMVLTALVLGYVTLVIVFKCYYIYLYSRPTDTAIIQQSETLNHNS
jgi:type III secretory pathway component EscU